ncbi:MULTISPECIES: YifB family Mg chelatase-like AAA ATPase [unclassified Campylobacter]|uniref:YifB family Mg chelatase-like AAA ATPase n=1 Tax=unclassified Campylobacter TaxID=2593542 RepID=UPI0014736391|nr:YifB family Mg chelatase-like AAA ATPase [Campylobacter sp. RM9328]MBE3021683.1 YifB family Mg chelatase-like AAA ATPase [Campylobacter sp. 7477a]
MKSLKCAAYSDGLKIIEVESTFSRGLPGFSIVGLAGASIKESAERVKAALLALNFSFPAQKITINLSPSDLPKSGSHFDLAIALLIALQKSPNLDKIFVFGELGLDGSIKNTANLFSILLFLSTSVSRAKVLVPHEIAQKASMIPNLEIYGVSNLKEAINFFQDDEFASSCVFKNSHPLFQNVIDINGESYVPNQNFELDFSDVLGQSRAKRACLIAAVGMHNIIFEGSPGCGKSMCAKRLVYILPPQSLSEILNTAAYRSLSLQDSEFSALRVFRAPHHTSTKSSIFGGGSSVAKIGEAALANAGVLFFDEFVHFPKQIIESLREPLEDHKIHISRVNSKITYDTKFLFAAALNPCPCGNLLSQELNCRCSENEIKNYKSRLSEPILDRMDLYVQMEEVSKDDRSDITSKQMSDLVLKAFKFQKMRGQAELNGKLSDADIAKFCLCDDVAKEILNTAVSRYHLSQRAIKKVLKVARSIADLEQSKLIQKAHILEALSFRARS